MKEVWKEWMVKEKEIAKMMNKGKEYKGNMIKNSKENKAIKKELENKLSSKVLMCEKSIWLKREVWKDWLLLKEKRYNLIRKSISNKLAKEKIMMLSMKRMGNEENNE